MHFSSNFSIHQEHSLYKDRMQFWMETVPDFLGIPRTNLTSTSGRMPVTSTHCPQQISTVTDITIKKITARETSETITETRTETRTESLNNHMNILKSDLRILLIVPFILIVNCV